MLILLILSLDLGFCSWGYNLDTGVGAFRYIVSPRQSTLLSESPSFFGYSFKIIKNGTETSFIIGAPKAITFTNGNESCAPDLKATGDLLECPVSNLFASTPANPTCNSRNPPGTQRGDAFGQSVDLSPDGNLLACSPGKLQCCSSAVYLPGYCYNEDNHNRSWMEDVKSSQNHCLSIQLDLMFVLDGSESVTISNFELVKNWTIDVASSFDIGSGLTKIGVIQYSHYWEELGSSDTIQTYIKTEIPLGSIKSQAKFAAQVRKIRYHQFSTFTAHAINKTIRDFQNSARWNDANTRKVIILLTDGRSSDFEYLPYSAA
uniref:VWFA domain-containing protein n=1 Tax=Ciona savignyi TaxID=51511 RepID=H2Y6Y5_CIOSA